KNIYELYDNFAPFSPACGCMYLVGNSLNFYLTDPSQRGGADQAIRAVFGRERVPAGGVQAVQGTYGFHQLHAWYRQMGSVFNVQGVVYTDMDERANRLTVAVQDQALVAPVRDELSSAGVPQDAVNIVLSDPIYSLPT